MPGPERRCIGKLEPGGTVLRMPELVRCPGGIHAAEPQLVLVSAEADVVVSREERRRIGFGPLGAIRRMPDVECACHVIREYPERAIEAQRLLRDGFEGRGIRNQ